jgi:hypothetical protein
MVIYRLKYGQDENKAVKRFAGMLTMRKNQNESLLAERYW